MKNLLFISLFCFSITFQGFSQKTKLQNDIKELLELTGSAKLGVQVANQLIESFKTSFPEVDQEFWNEFAKEIKPNDLIEMIIPIYEKHYTSSEIKELIAFYKTPIGQKTISKMPLISAESMQVGQAWGKEIAEKVVKKMEEK